MSNVGRCVALFLCVPILILVCGCPWGTKDPVPGETRTFNGIEFQWCPPGTFVMGYSEDQVPPDSDWPAQTPEHEVTLTEGFWLGKYEVTQAQWMQYMPSNPSSYSGNTNRPVECVDWDTVQDFIAALNTANGAVRFRLPTEAEWEYACRAGTATRFYWGNDATSELIDLYAWYAGNSESGPRPVGLKQPNDWGLYDMSGNVVEWCRDIFGPYVADQQTDPQGPPQSDPLDYRVIRGGSWYGPAIVCGSGMRFKLAPGYPNGALGFRLVRTAS